MALMAGTGVEARPSFGAAGTEAEHRSAAAGEISARIERLPISRWLVKARLIIGTATFFDAFDALAVAQALPVLVPAWRLSSQQVGYVIAIGFVGQLFGALVFGDVLN